MKKQIRNYDNYYIYDNGDVLNSNTNKITSSVYITFSNEKEAAIAI